MQPGNEGLIRQAIAAKQAQMEGKLPSAVKEVRKAAP
jgi:hypothetical protein